MRIDQLDPAIRETVISEIEALIETHGEDEVRCVANYYFKNQLEIRKKKAKMQELKDELRELEESI